MMAATTLGKAYGQARQNSLEPPSQLGSRPYGCANCPPMNVPTSIPAEKLGEKIENIRFRFEGFEISDAKILFNTPHGLSPT